MEDETERHITDTIRRSVNINIDRAEAVQDRMNNRIVDTSHNIVTLSKGWKKTMMFNMLLI